MERDHSFFLKRAVQLGREGVESNSGGPFGAVIVKDGEIIGEGCNRVTSSNDPTAHAEVVAIREACSKLNTFQLEGCTIYCSCEPCPMCLGAIYWARPAMVVFSSDHNDAAEIGFDDAFLYREFEKEVGEREIQFKRIALPEAEELFRLWDSKEGKIEY